jgi:hypothetical protein
MSAGVELLIFNRAPLSAAKKLTIKKLSPPGFGTSIVNPVVTFGPAATIRNWLKTSLPMTVTFAFAAAFVSVNASLFVSS